MPLITKRPRESVRETRTKVGAAMVSRDVLGMVSAASAASLAAIPALSGSAYSPTSMPFTGSRSSALSTVPDTSSVSMVSPVEKLYV